MPGSRAPGSRDQVNERPHGAATESPSRCPFPIRIHISIPNPSPRSHGPGTARHLKPAGRPPAPRPLPAGGVALAGFFYFITLSFRIARTSLAPCRSSLRMPAALSQTTSSDSLSPFCLCLLLLPSPSPSPSPARAPRSHPTHTNYEYARIRDVGEPLHTRHAGSRRRQPCASPRPLRPAARGLHADVAFCILQVVSGYVGNKIAVFVLQSLGCDVAALNTVQFSNHTGYRQWTGTKVSAKEITDLYDGLRQSYLDDFDMMLSGYIPGAEAVVAVGNIAKELKVKNRNAPGRFFWVLDPVMGDNGKIYVAEDVVPAYKSLLPYADLILPNQFEAEYEPPLPGARLLSEVKITDMDSLSRAIQALHDKYHIPHVVITSVRLSAPDHPPDHLCVVGSSMDSRGQARLFKIVFPSIDCYFCGTGDMFGALITSRMREAVATAADADLGARASWLSGDDVPALELPLARATEKVLASMHEVLSRTRDGMPAVVERTRAAMTDGDRADESKAHYVKTKAAELQLVRNLDCLRAPATEFRAKAI
ncbi:hypothetical protein PCL_05196 [Purpureocillium lilacinum]|uniref:pyridoxal kinase n=1 Tax=Purpureocillium lilacinum TaxID=33203 RepID=A0A2U3DVF4_PURLI|nr:hypothetical protein PCL_05196 [Purpureocillium lilacinum]